MSNPHIKAMVTGAGGFLGSHICRYLSLRGHSVAAVGRLWNRTDATDHYPGVTLLAGMTLPDPAFTDAVRSFGPQLLVHCAGTAVVADSVTEPYADFQRTVDVCAFALETLRTHAPDCKFIQLSSAAVYGNPSALPIDEHTPLAPISPYGFHKMMCETLVEEYRTLHGIRATNLRIFSAYGERLRRQVVYDLCRKIAAPDNNTIEIYGTGNESRDFVHAIDIAQAVLCAARSDEHPVINVASGRETSIRHLTDLVREALDSEKPLRFSGQARKGYPTNWRANIGRLSSLGFSPTVDLVTGIRAVCAWHRAGETDRWS